ncbi:MAG: SsrA-binding protein, partial [Verrucomicrobia bacterium]|nr:SsrA-binding protein [Verrucomicrobiota bacterium]
VKVEIGVGRGKTHSDKREDLKKRTADEEAKRAADLFNRRKL